MTSHAKATKKLNLADSTTLLNQLDVLKKDVVATLKVFAKSEHVFRDNGIANIAKTYAKCRVLVCSCL